MEKEKERKEQEEQEELEDETNDRELTEEELDSVTGGVFDLPV